jgi:hypothetical protein
VVAIAVTPTPADARWHPRPTSAPWQFQLQGRIDTSIPAHVFEVDGFDVSKRTVRSLHQQGRRVICYLDVGSWESYRPDADSFPRSVIGKRYDGYPDERWLDVRNYRLFAQPLNHRLRMCERKGFDAVEADNVAGWENRTGFPITRRDQLRFNRWVAHRAHAHGLSIGLKNDSRQAERLQQRFDFAVVEECFQYRECGPYRSFVRAGKAVFAVEYGTAPSGYCATAQRYRFAAIGKSLALRATPWRPCQPAGSAGATDRLGSSLQ